MKERLKIYFAWYDLWVGMFIDRVNNRLYICPLPCLVIRVQLGSMKPNWRYP